MTQNKIKPYLNEYVSGTYEDICREYLIKQNIRGEAPFVFDKIGKWWGNNRLSRSEEEIDIVAMSKEDILFAECKYKNQKTDVDVIEELINKARIFKYKNIFYYIFSKAGYTKRAVEKVKISGNIYLIDNETMDQL